MSLSTASGTSKLANSPSEATQHKTLENKHSSSRKDLAPFTFDQQLTEFGKWRSQPIWVPPKDASREMAQTMVKKFGVFRTREECWQGIVEEHRDQFTQVREIELTKASIRLPKAKLLVTVTEQEKFDTIEDQVPACVQTRLEEFLAGPGKQPGVKVSYLKPLCVEVGDELVFTTRETVKEAIHSIQAEVFGQYKKLYLRHRPPQWISATAGIVLKTPRKIYDHFEAKRQRRLDAYQAQLEFRRRKTALNAAKLHRKTRTDGCTFDEMLALTNPLERADVISQYSIEHELSTSQRDAMLRIAAGTLPWFALLAYGASAFASAAPGIMLTFAAPPVLMCDPAFVAEMPDDRGKLLKIGHFDEVGGVMHVEI